MKPRPGKLKRPVVREWLSLGAVALLQSIRRILLLPLDLQADKGRAMRLACTQSIGLSFSP